MSVKTVTGIDPETLDRLGAAYTDSALSFMDWMAKHCPSSMVAVKPRPNADVFTFYMKFTLPLDAERDVFVDRWGSHGELFSIVIGE